MGYTLYVLAGLTQVGGSGLDPSLGQSSNGSVVVPEDAAQTLSAVDELLSVYSEFLNYFTCISIRCHYVSNRESGGIKSQV